jgi:hypothetical protein
MGEIMKKINSPERLASIFKTFPVDHPNGVLVLESSEGEHHFYVESLRFVEYLPPHSSVVGDLGRRFAHHELISRQPPSFTKYEDLWKWLDIPDIFHFHRERFRDLAYDAFLRFIIGIDFEEGLAARFRPGEISRETRYLPDQQLHRFAADILRNTEGGIGYDSFTPDTIFMRQADIPQEVTFGALLLFQLLREPKSFFELLEESFFPPQKTINAIRELLRHECIAQVGGEGPELTLTSLSESLESLLQEEGSKEPPSMQEEIEVEIEGERKEERAEPRLSEIIAQNQPENSAVYATREKKAQEDQLLASLAYLIFVLLFALPWFCWSSFFAIFSYAYR